MKFVDTFTSFQNNNTWTLTETTKKAVKQKMQQKGYLSYDKKRKICLCRCIYCMNDTWTKENDERQWHPLKLCQYDHIIPFSQIVQNRKDFGYEDCIKFQNDQVIFESLSNNNNYNSGFPDMGELFLINYNPNLYFKVIYNDVDNLHIICTGHNQDKKNQLKYCGVCWCQLYGDKYPDIGEELKICNCQQQRKFLQFPHRTH